MSTTAPADRVGRELAATDHEVIAGVDRALRGGVELKQWWEGVDAADSYESKFEEAYVHNRLEDHSFGFFETADLAGGKTKVIGNVQEQLFHRPKAGEPEFIQNQIREFVLRYFMRVSVFRSPQPPEEGPGGEGAGPLKHLRQSLRAENFKLQGFGYSQRYYKKRGVEQVCAFDKAEQKVILDLRDLRENYEWSLLRNPIVDFELNFRPLGVRGPDLALPIPAAANWVIMSPDTITIDENPGKGLLGRYGLGYSFMKDPGQPAMFAYGPGQLEPTVQTLIWDVHENGDVIVQMCFVSVAPKALLSLSVNPLDWGLVATDLLTAGRFSSYLEPFRRAVNMMPFSNLRFDPVFPTINALNLLTRGAAESQLGISRKEIHKTLTFTHFLKHYNAVLGSRHTWEMFSDWTDESKLPDWVKNGESV